MQSVPSHPKSDKWFSIYRRHRHSLVFIRCFRVATRQTRPAGCQAASVSSLRPPRS
jgi:hypothetical protein